MTTWTSSEMYWSGRFVTATDWNNYFGASGNLAYLKETFGYYNASFYNITFMPQNVTTSMRLKNGETSFRIPISWGTGVYSLRMDIFTAQSQEAAFDARRAPVISINGIVSVINTQYTFAAVGARKPIYSASLHTVLNPNDLIEYRFFQSNVAGSFLMSATVQKMGL